MPKSALGPYGPVTQVEALSTAGAADLGLAYAQSRTAASNALAQLSRASGALTNQTESADQSQIASAKSPRTLAQMAHQWAVELQTWNKALASPARSAGDLPSTTPVGLRQAAGEVVALIGQATAANVSSNPGATALAQLQVYLTLPAAQQASQLAAVQADLASAVATIQNRLNLNSQGVAALQQLGSQIPVYLALGANLGQIPAQYSQLQRQLVQAQSSAQLEAVVASASQTSAQLASIAHGQSFCKPGLPAKIIYVSLTEQEMIAYQNGCPYLESPTTSGMPALPTPTGTFTIFKKLSPIEWISPWPLGSPYWYPTTWTHYGLEFLQGGYFLHDWPEEPVSAMGPGSEYSGWASRGCVHIAENVMAQLYSWASIGTQVVITG